MTTYKSYVTREIGNFVWDGFTDPAGVGVNVFDILDGAALVGVDLTEAQKEGVLNHVNNFGEWTSDDDEVRDLIADATDLQDYEKMYAWLALVVGDTTAADLVKGWQDEARDIVTRFDRRNFSQGEDSVTLPVKVWRDMLKADLKDNDDPDERDAIEAAAALLDGFEDSVLAINYVASDPVDFVVLPCGATTQAEQKICRELALN